MNKLGDKCNSSLIMSDGDFEQMMTLNRLPVYNPLFLLEFVLSILYFRTIKEQLL